MNISHLRRSIPGFSPLLPNALDWARALALFLGGFTALNLLGEWRRPGFDANEWWIDLRAFPRGIGWTALALASVFLVAFAIQPTLQTWRRRVTAVLVGLFAIAAAMNATQFYLLLAKGAIRSAWPLPLSLFIMGSLLFILRHVCRSCPGNPRRLVLLRVGLPLAACLVLFPLAQVVCFGKTDYRRPADAVIVLGARAYADGRPSDALADRVRTGSQLVREGLANKIIFSGGPGDGVIHETEVMRRMALELGVPAEAILLDPQGLSTRATIDNARVLFEREGIHDALGVSHFYHLPRLKLGAQRAGLNIRTVPARQSYFLRQTPAFVAREVVALWVYYLKGISR